MSIEIIKCLEDLDKFLKAKDRAFTKHVKRDRWQLSSYSLDQLQKESLRLRGYYEDDSNYVPDLYGCGLLSRSINTAITKGAVMMPEFYQNLGFEKHQAEEIIASDYRWY